MKRIIYYSVFIKSSNENFQFSLILRESENGDVLLGPIFATPF